MRKKQEKEYRIALVGNPNSGKTTLFNALTGAAQYVGNWPGVTVERKEGRYRKKKNILIQDLPGIYSLSPYTPEELVSRDYLIKEKPDLIINIIDGTNFERNLYLSTQLIEMGIPLVMAVNMLDATDKMGRKISTEALSNHFGCPVIGISALKNRHIKELMELAVETIEKKPAQKSDFAFADSVEQAIGVIETQLDPNLEHRRFFSVKLFEGDKKIQEELGYLPEPNKSEESDKAPLITNQRYSYIKNIMSDVLVADRSGIYTISDKVDKVVTHWFWSVPIFVAAMFAVYFLAIEFPGGYLTDLVNDSVFGESGLPKIFGDWLAAMHVSPWLNSLLIDGILAGVGAVLGFLPQMLVLFILLGILEDIGYMARIGFILDRIFRKFGFSGRSFIPMLISTGCGIPGIMASRTIESERDRKLTIMTTTFMPCSAKLPIISMIAGALFNVNHMGWIIAPSCYFLGAFAIVISGVMLKKMTRFSGEASPFVMELPPYHIPSIKNLALHTWDRLFSFVKKAGSIILLSSIAIWFLMKFSWNLSAGMIEDEGQSILSSLGNGIRYLFVPLGWGDSFEPTVATITGLIAKENVVNTLSILLGSGSDVSENGQEIWTALSAMMTPLAGYSFLTFNLLCAPCFAAIGAIRREMGTWKWTLIAAGFQTLFAYAFSLIVFQFGMLFVGQPTWWLIPAAICLAGALYLLIRPDLIVKRKKKVI